MQQAGIRVFTAAPAILSRTQYVDLLFAVRALHHCCLLLTAKNVRLISRAARVSRWFLMVYRQQSPLVLHA
jgi:hypothetical protein